METRLFKTKKEAAQYVRDNYGDARYLLTDSYITDSSDYDERDLPGYQWLGETPAWRIDDENNDTVALIAWAYEGDNTYELFIGGKLSATFDNGYDARNAYDKAAEAEEYEDDPRDVKLLRDGEVIEPVYLSDVEADALSRSMK